MSNPFDNASLSSEIDYLSYEVANLKTELRKKVDTTHSNQFTGMNEFKEIRIRDAAPSQQSMPVTIKMIKQYFNDVDVNTLLLIDRFDQNIFKIDNALIGLTDTGISPGTYLHVQVDSKGRVINGDNHLMLEWDKITSTPTTLTGYNISDAYSKLEVNSMLTNALSTLTVSWSNVINKPTSILDFAVNDVYDKTSIDIFLNNKIDKQSNIIPGTYTKVTFNNDGIILFGNNLLENDIPILSWSKINPISIPLTLTNIDSILDTKVDKNQNIEPGVFTKIQFDHKGLVIAGQNLIESDIPSISWSKIINRPTLLSDYNIQNAYTKSQVDALLSRIESPSWSSIVNKPVSLSGFGILDAYNKSEIDALFSASAVINNDTNTLLTNHINNEYLHSTLDQILVNSTNPLILDQFNKSQFRTAEYIIQAVQQNNIHITKILLSHDNINIYFSESNQIVSLNELIIIDSIFNNNDIQLIVTPINSSLMSIKTIRNIIPI